MAKKVVASLQSASKDFAKVIKMTKSPKSGAYTFKESIVPTDKVLQNQVPILLKKVLYLLIKYRNFWLKINHYIFIYVKGFFLYGRSLFF